RQRRPACPARPPRCVSPQAAGRLAPRLLRSTHPTLMEAAIVLLVLAVFYAVFMGALTRGFRNVVRASERQPPPATLPFVSVIIAARDEAATIAACVASVLANDYPTDGF